MSIAEPAVRSPMAPAAAPGAARPPRRRHVHEPVAGAVAVAVAVAGSRDWTWPILFALTLLSAVLRFSSITIPTVWGDEAAVAWRTCGTYAQFIEVLRNDGFVPLHYTYYWVLSRFVTLTPFWLRLLPTVAAVCMVPAMYFLASQLVSRRTALLVAAFTAVSSHIGWHAQDAKMYSHFWLMGVLCMGSFLWWMRTAGGVAFWCWVATGVCMVGLQSQGWAIIALLPILLLFRGLPAGKPGRSRWWRYFIDTAIFLLGMAIIAAGPLGYYLSFNRWTDNIQSRGWDASGIAWISTYFTPDAWYLVRDTTNHFLFGYDFPPPGMDGVTPVWAWQYAQAIPVVLYTLAAAALFPYPTRDRGRGYAATVSPTPWWRSALCLGMWALLPPYAFYCASVEDYPWPTQIVRHCATLASATGGSTTLAIGLLLLAMYSCGHTWRDRLWKWLQFTTVALVILAAATAIAYALRHRAPGPLWVSRYLGFVWPGFVIALFALLGRLPLPRLRWTVVGLLLALNLYLLGARMMWRQSPPLDRLAADFITAQESGSATHTHAIGMSPRQVLTTTEGRYHLFLYSRRPTNPNEFIGSSIAHLFGIPEGTVTDDIEKAFLAAPQTRRIIVWQHVGMAKDARQPPPIPKDKLLPRLPVGWRCSSEELFPYTSRWGWGALQGTWSRREFVAP